MKNIDKIQSVWVRFINQIDNKIEAKVRIDNHVFKEANLRFDQQRLIEAGAMKKASDLQKAQKWLNENKKFVLTLINEQFPTFWNDK